MAVDVKQQIGNCKACRRDAPEQKKESLLIHAVPNKPWRKVGMDIFTHSSINYLVIVDYFSDYFEFEKLSAVSSVAVIEMCKRCFAKRLGIPETMHSDNGPQFSAREFAIFSNEWDFQHTTSSLASQMEKPSVKSAKRLLKRTADPQLALLEYRNTITAGMTTSPIQRLLHPSTRSIIPQLDCGRTDDKSN